MEQADWEVFTGDIENQTQTWLGYNKEHRASKFQQRIEWWKIKAWHNVTEDLKGLQQQQKGKLMWRL